MESATAVSTQPQVTVGIDTGKQFHVAHAADQIGRPLGSHRMPTTTAGYRQFVSWAHGLGQLVTIGVEGSGHYGAGLARHLRAEGITVAEVGRPKCQRTARYGKSDDADAAGAAAIVLAGEALGELKSADGPAEMVRILRVARTSAVRARAKAYTALQSLLVTAPSMLREQLAGLYKDRLIAACENLSEPETLTSTTDAMILAIKLLAARCRELDAESERLAQHLDAITSAAAPTLRAVYGVGPDTAATLLAAVGDNPERITNDAAFAKLCGVSPLDASSGKTVRHRLNRGGNRDANRALHVILVVRLRRHQPTRDYLTRRLAEGKTKNEIKRCLKRYIAREIFHALHPPRTPLKIVA
ncbi:IS110 family transposase [Mycobacterium sp. M1]|uniref:IS110 family transposase n=1 Tax=Mycolicibacter acidiphilus TaxID=2835306 RepID=A0ABS5RMT9_9MYCO|nr:IS110 family transposase [Mycolicibacter acidiphilus]MBS9535615.1 IS110 family transposase [Mycolicibacter acidiphilus]